MVRGEPITLFGDGTTSRDYTYVADIVKGISAALDYSGSLYEVFNLGSGRPVDLLRMVAALEQSLGVQAQVKYQAEQPGDVRQTYADIGKARRILGYEPGTCLEPGIRQFVEWFESKPPSAPPSAMDTGLVAAARSYMESSRSLP